MNKTFNKRNQVNRVMCTDRYFRTKVVNDKRRVQKHKVDYKNSKNW